MTETATKFTEQQIEDHCKAMEGIAEQYPDSDPHKSARIIRQLQEEKQRRMAADDRDRQLYDE